MKISIITDGHGITDDDLAWVCGVELALLKKLLRKRSGVKLVTISLEESSTFDASGRHPLKVAVVMIFNLLGQEIKTEIERHTEGGSPWLRLSYPRDGRIQSLGTPLVESGPEEFAEGLYLLVKLFIGDFADSLEAGAGTLREMSEDLLREMSEAL